MSNLVTIKYDLNIRKDKNNDLYYSSIQISYSLLVDGKSRNDNLSMSIYKLMAVHENSIYSSVERLMVEAKDKGETMKEFIQNMVLDKVSDELKRKSAQRNHEDCIKSDLQKVNELYKELSGEIKIEYNELINR